MDSVKEVTTKQKGMEPTKLTASEVMGRMHHGERFAFIEARTQKEWCESDSRLPGAIRMVASEVEQHLREVPQGRTIITCCSCPNEESSTRLAVELMRRGFLHVHPLVGGIDGWRAAGGPVEPK
jgi:rhodanese-related sulfurtransferase